MDESNVVYERNSPLEYVAMGTVNNS